MFLVFLIHFSPSWLLNIMIFWDFSLPRSTDKFEWARFVWLILLCVLFIFFFFHVFMDADVLAKRFACTTAKRHHSNHIPRTKFFRYDKKENRKCIQLVFCGGFFCCCCFECAFVLLLRNKQNSTNFFLLGQLVIVFSAIKHKYTHNIQMAVLVSCNAHSPIIKTENLSDCCFSSYHNSNEAVRYRVVFCARLLELKTPIQTRMTHIFFIAVYIAYEPRIMRANRIHRLSHWQTILVASAFLFFHSVFI